MNEIMRKIFLTTSFIQKTIGSAIDETVPGGGQ